MPRMTEERRDQARALFRAEYAVDQSVNGAAKRAGISHTLARRFMAEPDFQAAHEIRVGELAAKAEVTAAEVLQTLAEIMRDKEKRDGDRIRAAELLGKHFAMWVDRLELDDKAGVAERIRAARERVAARN